MEILYISSLSSKSLINDICRSTLADPGFAVQKFNRLIVQGFVKNGIECKILSNPPITSKYNANIWIQRETESEDSIDYNYIPFVNIPIIKHLLVCIYTFIYVLKWGSRNRIRKCIVCDVLNVSASLGAIIASKIIRLQSIAVVTDLYGLMVNSNTSVLRNLLSKCASIVHNGYVSLFDKYVLLTEQMNDIVNPRHKPYIVMEALCEVSVPSTNLPDTCLLKDSPRTIIYAGGLYETYGLGILVDAFLSANILDATLVIYGDGPYVQKLMKICERNKNVVYMGVVPNSIVLENELKATLLVNPRPTTEEFTKYSFPSKNIEYMGTGTPLLTTKLPGMPKDYYPYVYMIEDESIKGYSHALIDVLSKTPEELIEFGHQAKNYVLENKNYIIQTRRIIELIQS